MDGEPGRANADRSSRSALVYRIVPCLSSVILQKIIILDKQHSKIYDSFTERRCNMSLSEKINSESTGKKIRHYLLLNGKNASDLAEHFGITRQGMSYKLENDSWDFKEIQKVAEYLKVTIQDLT